MPDDFGNVDVLFDLMFESKTIPSDWQWESDLSPRVPRITLETLERRGEVQIDRADRTNWRIRTTMSGHVAVAAACARGAA